MASGVLSLDADPEHGFEIRGIRTSDGAEVLAQMPWERGPAYAEADEMQWTRAWQGGWQIALPSAGDPCSVDRIGQGFHGAASQAKWELIGTTSDSVAASWSDGELLARREISIAADAVTVRTKLLNAGDRIRSAIATEHLIFGGDLIASGAEVLADGNFYPVGTDGLCVDEPEQQRWRAIPASSAPEVFGALTPAGVASVVVSGAGHEAVVSWDLGVLPHAWIWHESGAAIHEPWLGRGRALGIEPSSVRHANLAQAVVEGTAWSLAPRESQSWWVRVVARPSSQVPA